MLLNIILQLRELYQYILTILAFKNKKCINADSKFDLTKLATIDIKKMIKHLEIRKAIGIDGIFAKLVKMSAYVIDCHLSNIIIAYDTS